MLKLVETTKFRSGIVVLTYTPGPSGNGLFMRLGSGKFANQSIAMVTR